MDLKLCSKCKIGKRINEFSKDSSKNDGRRSACKECTRPINRGHQKKYYYQNRQKEIDRVSKYYANNREKELARRKKYRDLNPHRVEEYGHRRRARLNQSQIEDVPPRNSILEDQDGTCGICGRREHEIPYKFGKSYGKVTKWVWELDHIIPIGKGGRHAPDNVQVLCHQCNSKKRDRVTHVYDPVAQ